MPARLHQQYKHTEMVPVLLLGLPADFNAAYINKIQPLSPGTLFPMATRLIKTLLAHRNMLLCQQGVNGLYHAFKVAEPTLKDREHLIKETLEMLLATVVIPEVLMEGRARITVIDAPDHTLLACLMYAVSILSANMAAGADAGSVPKERKTVPQQQHQPPRPPLKQHPELKPTGALAGLLPSSVAMQAENGRGGHGNRDRAGGYAGGGGVIISAPGDETGYGIYPGRPLSGSDKGGTGGAPAHYEDQSHYERQPVRVPPSRERTDAVMSGASVSRGEVNYGPARMGGEMLHAATPTPLQRLIIQQQRPDVVEAWAKRNAPGGSYPGGGASASNHASEADVTRVVSKLTPQMLSIFEEFTHQQHQQKAQSSTSVGARQAAVGSLFSGDMSSTSLHEAATLAAITTALRNHRNELLNWLKDDIQRTNNLLVQGHGMGQQLGATGFCPRGNFEATMQPSEQLDTGVLAAAGACTQREPWSDLVTTGDTVVSKEAFLSDDPFDDQIFSGVDFENMPMHDRPTSAPSTSGALPTSSTANSAMEPEYAAERNALAHYKKPTGSAPDQKSKAATRRKKKQPPALTPAEQRIGDHGEKAAGAAQRSVAYYHNGLLVRQPYETAPAEGVAPRERAAACDAETARALIANGKGTAQRRGAGRQPKVKKVADVHNPIEGQGAGRQQKMKKVADVHNPIEEQVLKEGKGGRAQKSGSLRYLYEKEAASDKKGVSGASKKPPKRWSGSELALPAAEEANPTEVVDNTAKRPCRRKSMSKILEAQQNDLAVEVLGKKAKAEAGRKEDEDKSEPQDDTRLNPEEEEEKTQEAQGKRKIIVRKEDECQTLEQEALEHRAKRKKALTPKALEAVKEKAKAALIAMKMKSTKAKNAAKMKSEEVNGKAKKNLTAASSALAIELSFYTVSQLREIYKKRFKKESRTHDKKFLVKVISTSGSGIVTKLLQKSKMSPKRKADEKSDGKADEKRLDKMSNSSRATAKAGKKPAAKATKRAAKRASVFERVRARERAQAHKARATLAYTVAAVGPTVLTRRIRARATEPKRLCTVEGPPQGHECADPEATAEGLEREASGRATFWKFQNPGLIEAKFTRVEPSTHPESILRGEDTAAWECLKEQGATLMTQMPKQASAKPEEGAAFAAATAGTAQATEAAWVNIISWIRSVRQHHRSQSLSVRCQYVCQSLGMRAQGKTSGTKILADKDTMELETGIGGDFGGEFGGEFGDDLEGSDTAEGNTPKKPPEVVIMAEMSTLDAKDIMKDPMEFTYLTLGTFAASSNGLASKGWHEDAATTVTLEDILDSFKYSADSMRGMGPAEREQMFLLHFRSGFELHYQHLRIELDGEGNPYEYRQRARKCKAAAAKMCSPKVKAEDHEGAPARSEQTVGKAPGGTSKAESTVKPTSPPEDLPEWAGEPIPMRTTRNAAANEGSRRKLPKKQDADAAGAERHAWDPRGFASRPGAITDNVVSSCTKAEESAALEAARFITASRQSERRSMRANAGSRRVTGRLQTLDPGVAGAPTLHSTHPCAPVLRYMTAMSLMPMRMEDHGMGSSTLVVTESVAAAASTWVVWYSVPRRAIAKLHAYLKHALIDEDESGRVEYTTSVLQDQRLWADPAGIAKWNAKRRHKERIPLFRHVQSPGEHFVTDYGAVRWGVVLGPCWLVSVPFAFPEWRDAAREVDRHLSRLESSFGCKRHVKSVPKFTEWDQELLSLNHLMRKDDAEEPAKVIPTCAAAGAQGSSDGKGGNAANADAVDTVDGAKAKHGDGDSADDANADAVDDDAPDADTADPTAADADYTPEAATEAAAEVASQPAPQPVPEPASEPTPHPTHQLTPQPAPQPAPQLTPQSASEPASEPASGPASEPASGPASEPASEPAPQPAPQPALEVPPEALNMGADADVGGSDAEPKGEADTEAACTAGAVYSPGNLLMNLEMGDPDPAKDDSGGEAMAMMETKATTPSNVGRCTCMYGVCHCNCVPAISSQADQAS